MFLKFLVSMPTICIGPNLNLKVSCFELNIEKENTNYYSISFPIPFHEAAFILILVSSAYRQILLEQHNFGKSFR